MNRPKKRKVGQSFDDFLADWGHPGDVRGTTPHEIGHGD
jgi:hypothetical protein